MVLITTCVTPLVRLTCVVLPGFVVEIVPRWVAGMG
jgi:hypothetical protein